MRPRYGQFVPAERSGDCDVDDTDRFRLVAGPYTAPTVRRGDTLFCEARQCPVVVTGYSTGPLPWPKGQSGPKRKPGIIVCGGLAQAVRAESNQALARLMGVSADTITRWRAALGVGRVTPGTHAIHLSYTRQPWFGDFIAKGRAPEVIRRIADANRGQKRPRRRRWPGRPEDWVPRGRAWTRQEDRWVRHLSIDQVVRRTGRTRAAVHIRRRRLGVQRPRKQAGGHGV